MGTPTSEVPEEQRLDRWTEEDESFEGGEEDFGCERDGWEGGGLVGKIRGPPADDDAAVHRDAWAPAFTATTLASGLGYILHLHPAQIPIS